MADSGAFPITQAAPLEPAGAPAPRSPGLAMELDLVLPEDPSHVPAVVAVAKPAAVQPRLAAAAAAPAKPAFDPDSTLHFQAKMTKAPEWFCSFLAGNTREKRRLRDELAHMKGAWPLLMKQRNGGKWTPDEKVQLQAMVKSASSVSPYLFIWAIPGSMLLLPFLAWFLDRQRKRALRKLR